MPSNIDQLWKNTQEELKIVLAPAVFQTFVSPTQLVSLVNNTATIGCPNSYLVDINCKRYYHLFKEALDNQTKTPNTLDFIIQPPIKPSSDSLSPLFTYSSTRSSSHGLHPQYTFDNLIVGNSNNFAFAAAQGIIKTPGTSYNPFFIWGGVGVGKTHLMQAIGHELFKTQSDFKLKYFPAETFANDLILSLKSKSTNQFKDKYRQLDCILVDDIQFLAGKEYIQEEFFHTFNALHMSGKQIVLTSDRRPSEINGLEDRLVSRFMGGLTVDIQPPDFEMRCAIINQKAESRGVKITPEATRFLAENLASNTRDIEGKIQQLAVKALSGRVGELDLVFVQDFLHPPSSTPLSSSSVFPKLTPRHLISICAKHFNLKTSELCGQSRKKDLAFARHITAYLLLTQINLPLKEVGRYLGGRDHTSIMHARDKITQQVSTNSAIKNTVHQIRQLLQTSL